ncbi:halocyanin domain-containing protein [Halopelagius inordinatus]|uniref:Halocyanin domain-containing protein n=1 Tax=Halopelagius inordinatus TaxID=553467 RepID=A0A1I2VKP7_9EURY|nr:halocyanin domain-containing protein [Halopelagius inordinatus]SFG88056.1 halocyanin domain-containing protein [Halopelagius inordinatus]
MTTQPLHVDRRTFLAGTAGVLLSTGLAPGTASAQSTADPVDIAAWFEGVDNYDGVADATGHAEVTVAVGAEANGGGFGFGPAAINVDPGTTVVWEWTGEGGSHNVEASDGSFESEMAGDAGHTFEHAFENEGVTTYYCMPHRAMGMKGAVLVGDVGDVDVGGAPASSDPGGRSSEPNYEGWFDNVGNYESTAERRGESTVTVSVGAPGNGGAFAFDPPAIRVSPGTTVVWEWTGSGMHSVTATDGSFESEMVAEAGHTFEHTFASGGIHTYACPPHEALGMKGAVVVSDGGAAEGTPPSDRLGDYLTLGFGASIVAAVLGIPYVTGKERKRPPSPSASGR